MIENENGLMKDLIVKANVTDISELKCEIIVKKVFRTLLEIDENCFDVQEWNKACNYFMENNEIYKTTYEARYSLMSFLSKEWWRIW